MCVIFVGTHATKCMGKSGYNYVGFVIFHHYVGSVDETQIVVRLSQ